MTQSLYLLFCIIGATFSTDAAKFLIQVVKTNHDLLINSNNTDHFWREVSDIMSSRGFHFDGPTCERKFQAGQKLYRNQMRDLARTGAEGLDESHEKQWFCSKDMQVIMANDEIVQPTMTVSAGSSNIVTLAQTQGNSSKNVLSQREQVNIPRIGRSRIPQLRRPKSKHEARTDAFLQLAAAMNRRTDVLLTSKTSTVSVPNPDSEDEEEENLRLWNANT